jgi:hypothetical protein
MMAQFDLTISAVLRRRSRRSPHEQEVMAGFLR